MAERVRVGDLARAAIELAIARVNLDWDKAQAAPTPDAENLEPEPRHRELIERVAYLIPRVAARLPWRADCLVQAMAARRWLARSRVPTTLHFGMPRQRSGDFEAHAWLKAGNRVVTGGDVSAYQPFER